MELGKGHFDKPQWTIEKVQTFLSMNKIEDYFFASEYGEETGKPHFQLVFLASGDINYANIKSNRKYIKDNSLNGSYSLNHNFKSADHQSNTVLYTCKGFAINNIEYTKKGDINSILRKYKRQKLKDIEEGNVVYWTLYNLKKKNTDMNHVQAIVEVLRAKNIPSKYLHTRLISNCVLYRIYGQHFLGKGFKTLEGIYHSVRYHFFKKDVERDFHRYLYPQLHQTFDKIKNQQLSSDEED